MCEQCEAGPVELPDAAKGRRKLWEIAQHLHCSIVGTCLSMDDLRKLTRKGGMRVSEDATDYCIHSYYVREAGSNGKLGRLLHKMLDDRHAVDIRRFSAAGGDAVQIEALWNKAFDSGRVAGAYWAIMSLRAVPQELVTTAYGQVHMLSHVLGSYNRNAIQRVAAAEKQIVELTRQRDAAQAAKLELERSKEKQIRDLESELLRVRCNAPAQPASSDPREAAALKSRLVRAEQRLSAERERRRAAEARIARLELLDDGEAPQQMPAATAQPAEAPATIDVAGQCVLYVGGRQALVPHIRSAVERRQGRLLHHDGGLEQAPRILENLVTQADMVFCPLDCVSHAACLRVKRLCQRLDKPFLLLRSSGASSLVRALRPDAHP